MRKKINKNNSQRNMKNIQLLFGLKSKISGEYNLYCAVISISSSLDTQWLYSEKKFRRCIQPRRKCPLSLYLDNTTVVQWFVPSACVCNPCFICLLVSFFLSFSFPFFARSIHLHCNAFHAVAATLRRHAQSFGRKKKFTCRLLHRIRKYSNTFAWTFRYNDPRCVLLPNYTRWTHNFAKHIFILASTSQFIICRCHFLMAVINIYVGHACILQSNLLQIL